MGGVGGSGLGAGGGHHLEIIELIELIHPPPFWN